VRREAGELDIHKPSIATGRQYARALYNCLFAIDESGKAVGELVERWESADAKVYTFFLRKGVKFHDGTDFDAEAVKFNFARIKDPATAAFFANDLASLQQVDVIDSHTVRLTLAAADATLPARLSDRTGWIVSPAGVQKWGNDFAVHPVGTGPFEFVEWVKDDHLTVKRFAGYWEKDAAGNQLPYLDQLTFKPVTDLTQMLNGIRAGSFDMIETILPNDLEKVKADTALKYTSGRGAFWTMGFNNAKAPFNNASARRAVAWAIDREALHRGIFFGLGSPAAYPTPPGHWATDPNGPIYKLDLAKAREELTKGGLTSGFAFTAVVSNVTIDLQVAQAVKAQLAPLNIDMTIQPLEATVVASRRTSGDFEASFAQTPPAADPSQDLQNPLQTGGSSNSARYSNPQVDSLLGQARAITDQKQRADLYAQVQKLIFDDSPTAYVHIDADLKVMRTNVEGMVPAFDGFIRLTPLWKKG
jgi:peptide/nickel transport system substrate-binding protein